MPRFEIQYYESTRRSIIVEADDEDAAKALFHDDDFDLDDSVELDGGPIDMSTTTITARIAIDLAYEFGAINEAVPAGAKQRYRDAADAAGNIDLIFAANGGPEAHDHTARPADWDTDTDGDWAEFCQAAYDRLYRHLDLTGLDRVEDRVVDHRRRLERIDTDTPWAAGRTVYRLDLEES